MADYRAESTRCTALTRKGGFCDAESLPDAPFPICIKHASMLLRYLNSVTPSTFDDRIITAVRMMEQHREIEAERKRRNPKPEVVYYVQVGHRIKIGTTGNLSQRLRAYPPGWHLLATEPGGLALEAQRHAQFAADLDAGREWFRPSPALLAHIKQIRAEQAA